MRVRSACLFAAVLLFGFRCSLPWENSHPSELSIVSYNVHNLFDDVDDGGEYPEFKLDSGKWNARLYEKRLAAAATAVCSFSSDGGESPDLICLQEIENEKVLKDLAAGPLRKGGYRWLAIGGPADSAVKCGILSRFPLESVKAHSLVDAGGFGSGRDMLEATISLGGEGSRLTIFVCHWKSRKEGEAETEPVRRLASKLAASRVAEIAEADPERCIIVCGDFNESPDEFSRAGRRYPTALMPDPLDMAGAMAQKGPQVPDEWFRGVIRVASIPSGASLDNGEVSLYSPWIGADGFSYVFDGDKERLDGFLLSPSFFDGQGAEYRGFMVSAEPALLDESGEPALWNGSSGFSDHLPVALRISAGNQP